jgi:hypothetical protein
LLETGELTDEMEVTMPSNPFNDQMEVLFKTRKRLWKKLTKKQRKVLISLVPTPELNGDSFEELQHWMECDKQDARTISILVKYGLVDVGKLGSNPKEYPKFYLARLSDKGKKLFNLYAPIEQVKILKRLLHEVIWLTHREDIMPTGSRLFTRIQRVLQNFINEEEEY